MSRIPIVIKEIALLISLLEVTFLLLRCKLVIVLHLLSEQIAFVESTCIRAMQRTPVAHADPTELISARGTCHMIAAFVFLDRLFTTRTRFRVCHNPKSICRFGAFAF